MDRRKTKKRIKQEKAQAMDRISELSDDILASIISRLSLDEALSTSLLSKRWKYIWTFTSGSLNFDSSSLENVKTLASNLKKYIEWINQVLELHRSSTITEFSVYSCSDVIYKSCIDKWFDFAISKNAQIFELDLSASATQYTQTSKRYHISTLQNCFSSFKSLRSFTLKNVDVDGDTLEFILSSCPFLERLSVNKSGDLEALNVYGSSLQLMHLELTCCKFLKKIEISAPNLVSFNYFGSNFQLNVESAPLLVDVSIGEDCPTRSIITSSFHMLRSYLSQLETLKLDFSQQIQVPELELTNLRHLVIGGQLLHFENLLGVISIINDSPFLQRFELELHYKKSYLQLKRSYLQNGRRSMLTPPECTHQHLKIVELKNFTGQALDLDLAIYLLENASMLEKMIIRHERKLFARLKIEQLKTKLPPGVELIIDSD